MNNGNNSSINQQINSNELSTTINNNPEETFLNTINSEQINNYILYNTLLSNTGNTSNIALNMENINRFSNILNFENESSPSARYLALQQQQQQVRSNHPHSHAHHSHDHSHTNEQQQFIMNMPHGIDTNSETNNEEIQSTIEQNETHDEQMNNQNNIFRMALLALQTNLPIILILFIKVFHQHMIG